MESIEIAIFLPESILRDVQFVADKLQISVEQYLSYTIKSRVIGERRFIEENPEEWS